MVDTTLIPPNSLVKDPGGHQWIVGAVHSSQGERYYFLTAIEKNANVSLMPAFVVEQWERV